MGAGRSPTRRGAPSKGHGWPAFDPGGLGPATVATGLFMLGSTHGDPLQGLWIDGFAQKPDVVADSAAVRTPAASISHTRCKDGKYMRINRMQPMPTLRLTKSRPETTSHDAYLIAQAGSPRLQSACADPSRAAVTEVSVVPDRPAEVLVDVVPGKQDKALLHDKLPPKREFPASSDGILSHSRQAAGEFGQRQAIGRASAPLSLTPLLRPKKASTPRKKAPQQAVAVQP